MNYEYPDDPKMILDEISKRFNSYDPAGGITFCADLAHYAIQKEEDGYYDYTIEEWQWHEQIFTGLFPQHIEQFRFSYLCNFDDASKKSGDSENDDDDLYAVFHDDYPQLDKEEVFDATLAAIDFFPIYAEVFFMLYPRWHNFTGELNKKPSKAMLETMSSVHAVLNEVWQDLKSLVLSSDHRDIRERALRALGKINVDEAFVIEQTRHAILTDTKVGPVPIWIAISKGQGDLGEQVAKRLYDDNEDDASLKTASASYIGLFRIEGHDEKLARLVDNDSYGSSPVDAFSDYQDFYKTYDYHYPTHHHIAYAVIYALTRLQSPFGRASITGALLKFVELSEPYKYSTEIHERVGAVELLASVEQCADLVALFDLTQKKDYNVAWMDSCIAATMARLGCDVRQKDVNPLVLTGKSGPVTYDTIRAYDRHLDHIKLAPNTSAKKAFIDGIVNFLTSNSANEIYNPDKSEYATLLAKCHALQAVEQAVRQPNEVGKSVDTANPREKQQNKTIAQRDVQLLLDINARYDNLYLTWSIQGVIEARLSQLDTNLLPALFEHPDCHCLKTVSVFGGDIREDVRNLRLPNKAAQLTSVLEIYDIQEAKYRGASARYLSIDCSELVELCQLEYVEELTLWRGDMEVLPKELAQLKQLRKITLYEFPNLRRIPSEIIALEHLRVIEASSCPKVTDNFEKRLSRKFKI